MIITRTPFRVSLAGGGTDLKNFYDKNGYGAVISTAIQQYMYIVIHPYFHDKIRIKYSKTEDVEDVNEIQHPIVRECLKRVGVDKGVEIASFADVSSGTGLGSSSAFTVGLLNALYAYRGKLVTKDRLAAEACEIEIDILNEPIGKQDQYAAAFGNINYIRFNKDETVEVSPLLLAEKTIRDLEKSLRLYFIGGQRRSRDILADQSNNLSCNSNIVDFHNKILHLVEEIRISLTENNINSIGAILQKGWLYKKELSKGITNNAIDRFYDNAIKHGAKGGKLLGAGSAGFLLVYHNDHNALSRHMGCKELPFKVDREGTKIIFYD